MPSNDTSDIPNIPASGSVVCRLPGTTDAAQPTLALFEDPEETITASSMEQVRPALQRVCDAMVSGKHAAGFLAYDAAPAFDPAHRTRPRDGSVPLAWFAIYDAPPREFAIPPPRPDALPVAAGDPKPETNAELHVAAVEKIKRHIFEGDVYQVNLTFRAVLETNLHPWNIFLALTGTHPVPYPAYLDTGDLRIVSISPELFLEKLGSSIKTAPMKGTAPRGETPEKDASAAAELAADTKNRAENLMILDMARNDLGKICETGSVKAERIFHVDTYKTLHQMISVADGTLLHNATMLECMDAAFPPASITGAPKIRATKIIADTETSPRGVYTGAIGCALPTGDFLFNVAIRTLECQGRRARMGAGGGIVADSNPIAEWEEALLKTTFATALPPFEALETILWSRDTSRKNNILAGCAYLEEHLERMANTQKHFKRTWNETNARNALEKALAENDDAETARIRLLADERGHCHATATPIDKNGWRKSPAEIALLTRPKGALPEPFEKHKTTVRKFYDDTYGTALKQGFDEVLFANPDGEIAEGAISNVFMKINEKWKTPRLEAGILPGIWRADTITKLNAEETRLTLDDLISAEKILVGNSVRGGTDAEIAMVDTRTTPNTNADPEKSLRQHSGQPRTKAP